MKAGDHMPPPTRVRETSGSVRIDDVDIADMHGYLAEPPTVAAATLGMHRALLALRRATEDMGAAAQHGRRMRHRHMHLGIDADAYALSDHRRRVEASVAEMRS